MTLPYPWHAEAQKRRRKSVPELKDGLEFLELYDRENPGKLARAFQWRASGKLASAFKWEARP